MSTTKHIEWIGELKGACALFVVLGHLLCAFGPVIRKGELWFIYNTIGFVGGLAVPVFIILSAIIMTEKSADSSTWQFLIVKRYFRLMLPCAAVLVLYFLLWSIGAFNNNALADIIGVDWLRSTSPLHLKGFIKSMIFSPFGVGQNYLNILWMMKYILASPFVVVLMRVFFDNTKLPFKMLALSLLIYMLYGTDPFYINIVWGFVLVYMIKPICEDGGYVRKYKMIILPLLVVFLASIIVGLIKHPSSVAGLSSTLVSCALMSIIYIYIYISRNTSRGILIRSMRWLGKISFEIYLLHLIVIYSVVSNLYPIVPSYIQTNYWVWCGITLAITIPLAYLWKKCINDSINLIVAKITNKIIKF